jgi:hypothetical protein
MKPAIVLMVKSQSLNMPSWKVVKWLSCVTDVLEKMEREIIAITERRIQ